MRKIKFRAWIKTGNEIDDYVKPMTIQQMIHSKESTFSLGQLNDLVYFEQFTGLKDRNDKEIYEGDIVHGYDQEPDRDDGYIGSSVIDVVNFKYGAFWIGDSWNNIMVMTPPIVEVIGNVHENPELLEGARNND